MVRGAEGSDPAAVVFDALEAAEARERDVVIIDTAGRLHTQQHLMDELAKVRKVIEQQAAGGAARDPAHDRRDHGPERPRQALLFREVVDVSGIALPSSTARPRAGSRWRSPRSSACRSS